MFTTKKFFTLLAHNARRFILMPMSYYHDFLSDQHILFLPLLQVFPIFFLPVFGMGRFLVEPETSKATKHLVINQLSVRWTKPDIGVRMCVCVCDMVKTV